MPGPHVTLATFCDKVLIERDGVLSVIRAVDRLMVLAVGPGAPAEIPERHRVEPTLVVSLHSDEATGRHAVTIDGEQPDGSRLPSRAFDVTFEPGDRGINLVLPMSLEAVEGLYWFDIRLDANDDGGGQLLSRVPLRIMYQRMPGVP